MLANFVSAKSLRIASYNIDSQDQSSDYNITNATRNLGMVIKGMGLHHIGRNAHQVDILGLEELNSGSSLKNFSNTLAGIYGAGVYAYDTSTASASDGLIYNKQTVQIISVRSLKTGSNVLLTANGTYTNASMPGGGTNGVARAPILYHIRPIGFPAYYDFYMYVSHARAGSDNSVGDGRYCEAQEVRSDAKYKLPARSHILYTGDWNLGKGSGENAYKCLVGRTTSDGTNWSDTSSIWANTNQTKGCDPMSQVVPPTFATFNNNSSDNATWMYTQNTDNINARIDIQLPNQLMYDAYNTNGGVQIAPDDGDPFDPNNFPSSKYHYAFETFGNNGSTPLSGSSVNAANNSLDDLTNTVPNDSAVYAAMHLVNPGATFTGSDHYAIVGDYNIVVPQPVISAPTMVSNKFQFKLTSTTSTGVTIQAASALTNWTSIGTATTDTNGNATFQDASTPFYNQRVYRALSTNGL